MNSAVNNFKGRIKNILEENEIDEKNSYEVMTIHTLAVKIIKEKPEVSHVKWRIQYSWWFTKNILY